MYLIFLDVYDDLMLHRCVNETIANEQLPAVYLVAVLYCGAFSSYT
jgi:hypothetical protein